MSYDSFRNKHLLQFSDGRLMLIAEVSSNNVTDWRGRRIWDWTMFHPKGSLFYTKESLKQEQTSYVENQLQGLRDWHKQEVEKGWAKEYIEPTLDSYDYNGTKWPGGPRIKHGKAFFGGRPTSAEEFVAQWGNPETITFEKFDKDFHSVAKETCNIMQKDIDDLYREFVEEYGACCISIR